MPFAISGTFRAYGQRIDVVKQIETEFSYFTVNKINLANTPVLINGVDMTEELDVDLGEGAEYQGDYWYAYVRSGLNYDFSFAYNLDENDPFDPTAPDYDKIARVSNTTVEIGTYTHYNCIVNIHRTIAQSAVYAQAYFPDFIFQSKEVHFYINPIDYSLYLALTQHSLLTITLQTYGECVMSMD